jgi:diguanylate cyclase (GGDEF)-like protein
MAVGLGIGLTAMGLKGSAQEYSYRSFGAQDGLKNLAIRSIYQDRIGFIWVNTENGIYRYDGESFEAFGAAQGIPPQMSVAFGEAPGGTLLAGGDSGLYQFSGDRFEKLSVPFTAVNSAQGIQSDGQGHTYLATDAGLAELSAANGSNEFTFRLLPRPAVASSPAASSQAVPSQSAYSVMLEGGIIWYGCGVAVCRVDGKGTTVLGKEDGLPADQWQTILKDRDGALWVSGRATGILERPAGQTLFRKPNAPAIAAGLNGIPALDADGRVLLPSPSGLFISTEHGWHKIDRASGLRGAVYSVFEDRQQSLWIGLAGRGLAQWRGYRQWETYSADSGLSTDIVYEILPLPDGSVYAATQAGLYKGLRNPFGEDWSQVTELGSVTVHSLQMDTDGDLWVGTEDRGAARIHLATHAVTWFGARQGLTERSVYTLHFDHQRRLWAATEDGLFVAQPPYKQFTRIDALPHSRTWTVTENKAGIVWAGGTGGLFEFDGERWRIWTHADGLSNQEVLSLGVASDGVVWVGYSFGGGIDRVHPTPDGVTIEKGVQRRGTTGIVYFLDFDSLGRLWAGTDHGVDIWNGARWGHYDVSDGLAWDDCNLNAFAEEPGKNVYWIGTSGGLSRFAPRPHDTRAEPAQVVFTSLIMGQAEVSGLQDPTFRMGENSLTARFSALNVDGQNEVAFRYRLEGSTSAWVETAQRQLQFVNIAPGSYRLEVEADDGLGSWSGHGAEFAFTILQPWYRTWWFIALCLMVPPLAVFAVLRLRVAGARARERELVNMVEDKTADLQRANEELVRLSSTDSLTGLANRRFFDQTLDEECARIRRSSAELALVLFDVDHFKALNDTLGHPRGDMCLAMLASEMNLVARRSVDLAARCGGEEFAIILPNTGLEGARRVAEAVRQGFASLNLPHPASPIASYLTVSAGVAVATREERSTPESLIAAADRALYAAKRSGRNRVVVAAPEPSESAEAGLSASRQA